MAVSYRLRALLSSSLSFAGLLTLSFGLDLVDLVDLVDLLILLDEWSAWTSHFVHKVHHVHKVHQVQPQKQVVKVIYSFSAAIKSLSVF